MLVAGRSVQRAAEPGSALLGACFIPALLSAQPFRPDCTLPFADTALTIDLRREQLLSHRRHRLRLLLGTQA
jgi:hypothetical protein